MSSDRPDTPTEKPRLGRPPLDDPADHRVRVYLRASEVADLDARRGDLSRSEWLARAAGIRAGAEES